MTGKHAALAGAVLAAAGLAAFGAFAGREVPVRAVQAQRETIQSSILTNGQIEPLENFAAYAPGPTTVRRVLVRQGERVRPGQLLVELDGSDARATAARALAQLRHAEAELNAILSGGTREEVMARESSLVSARAELESAQRHLEAMRRLQGKGAASQGEVKESEVRFQRAQASLELLERQQTGRYAPADVARAEARKAEAQAAYDAAQSLLRNSNVVAPSSGIVYWLPVRQGAFVRTGEPLVQVAELEQVQVRAFVDEPDIGRLAEGQKVILTWDALPGRSWEGTVTQVPTTVTLRGTRTVGEITCTVDNADLRLIPNVNVNVTVVTARRENALTVAREAVHLEGGRRFVYEVVDGRLQLRQVDTALSNLTRIEITSGIAEDAVVALTAEDGQRLSDGLAVRVAQQ